MKKPQAVASKTPIPSDDEALRRFAVMDRAVRQTGLQLDELESALGMYMIGFHFGWKVLLVIHTKKTIAKYEDLLGIKVREEFPEFGPDAGRTNAYKLISAVSSYWKLVSGDVRPLPELDKRGVTD